MKRNSIYDEEVGLKTSFYSLLILEYRPGVRDLQSISKVKGNIGYGNRNTRRGTLDLRSVIL